MYLSSFQFPDIEALRSTLLQAHWTFIEIHRTTVLLFLKIIYSGAAGKQRVSFQKTVVSLQAMMFLISCSV